MKKFFKIALIVLLCLGGLVVIAGIAILMRLPSAAKIGQAISKKNPNIVSGDITRAGVNQSVSDDGSIRINDPITATVSADQTQALAQDADLKQEMLEDVLNPNRPMSDFCASLKNSKDALFQSNEEVDQAMQLSAKGDSKDTRIQAMKPTFRYMFQLPKMSDLMRETQAAGAAAEDESFFEKAGFYARAVAAFNEVKNHKTEIESVMDRSYFYLALNNLVAKKPEMLTDQRVQNYCSNVEIAFNQKREVSYEEEKKDFLNLLNDLNVKPSDIRFDPNYKTQIDFVISAKTINLQGQTWLSELFKADDAEPDPVAR